MTINSPEKPPEFPPPLPHSKKTRELPNISDCNCCNRRINNTNPKNRIRILTSEWRIILLCKSCHNLVESSQFCSYCLARVSNDSYFDCKKCRRRIHKECVGKCSNFGSDFVCFDCWMPNLLENEYKRDRIARIETCSKKRKLEKVSDVDMLSSLKTRAFKPKKEKGKKLLNGVKNANVFVERMVVLAMEAKPKAVTKIMVAKKAAEIASGSLDVVTVEKGGSSNGDHGGSVVDEDAQLAIKLHRSMNSSRRISRNPCVVNTHCEDVPDLNDSVVGLESQGENETSCLGKVANGEGSLMGRERNGFCLSGIKQECGDSYITTQSGKCNACRITYVRKRRASTNVKPKEEPEYVKCKEDLEDVKCKIEPLECSLKVYCRKMSLEKCKVDANNCSQLEKRNVETNHCFLVEKRDVDANYASQVEKCNMDASYASQVEKHYMDASHCSRTYIRRNSHCKRSLSNGSLNLDNGNLGPATLHCLDDAS